MQKHCLSPKDRAPYPRLRPAPKPLLEPAGELSRLINAELMQARRRARQKRRQQKQEARRG